MLVGNGIRLVQERMESTFWFRPLAIIVLIVSLLYLPNLILPQLNQLAFLNWSIFKTSSNSAQLILSALATGLMTVVGVLFSITVVVLQLASSQFTPRIMEKFIRSGPSKNILGLYIGTFLYCLLLLNQASDDGTHITRLKLALAISLGFLCLWMLVLFIHHIIHSIKSTDIISEIVREADKNLISLVKSFEGYTDYYIDRDITDLSHKHSLRLRNRGYLEGIHWDQMSRIMKSQPFHMELTVATGDFVIEDQVVARLFSDEPISEKKCIATLEIFKVGPFRTFAEDVRLPLRQLSDISLRSLSPAMNDPTTATEAVNGMAVILAKLTQHYHIPRQVELDEGQTILFHAISFEDLVDLAFNQILPILGPVEIPLMDRIQDVLRLCIEDCHSEDKRRHLMSLKVAVLQQQNRAKQKHPAWSYALGSNGADPFEPRPLH